MQTLPRAGLVLTARPGVPREALTDALRGRRPALVDRLGDGGDVRMGVPIVDDPFAAVQGERGEAAPTDAVVEISAAEGAAVEELVDAVEGLGRALEDVVDARASTGVAGTAHLVVAGSGPFMLGFVGRRDPSIDPAAFSTWWLDEHAPLARSIVGEHFLGYQQLHGEERLTDAVLDAAGFSGDRFDVFESAFFATVEDYLAPFADPDDARRLYEDEVGHVDHGAVRGAFTQLLE